MDVVHLTRSDARWHHCELLSGREIGAPEAAASTGVVRRNCRELLFDAEVVVDDTVR